MKSPDFSEVVKLREYAQSSLGLGITAAQDYCAKMLHTSRRAWQQWERDERNMHPAFWELAQIKLNGPNIDRSQSEELNTDDTKSI